MKIVSVGGGPAGLYFSILMKKAFPHVTLDVHERNRADDTFGWGVVFSRETLGNLADADRESYDAINNAFVSWEDIDTFVGGEKVTSTGHGFCGLSRRKLLLILQERARAVGVRLHFESDVKPEALPAADLILAADGVHSPMRSHFAKTFAPSLDWRRCKFTWLGTTKPLSAFTFIFKDTPHGLFQVHAYPFEAGTSTFIVECREEVWKRAGLDAMTEAQSVAFLEALFEKELEGHRLLANKSIWRTFPTVSCAQWVHDNIVILGDAAHTAHFSIGSGTKLAMEDAMGLVEAFKKTGLNVPAALSEYSRVRRPEVARIQRAAQTSLEWFENSARYLKQPPLQFVFNLMTRSKRITWNNLRQRDPNLVARVDEDWAQRSRVVRRSDGSAPPPLFAPFTLRSMTVPNRVAVSPMCQYVAKDGLPGDWHLVHLGARAVGGAGLIVTEMTDVSPEGRITLGCTGLWNAAQTDAWKRIVDFVHAQSPAKIGVQLGHAGRKGSCTIPWEGDRPLTDAEGAWETLSPSALPYVEGSRVPKAMTLKDLERVKAQFVTAAQNAQAAGFDFIELHCAHGYLLSSFLTPLANVRTDDYGGSLDNRLRYPLEVFDAIRAVWPAQKPMAVRITASDWLGAEGLTGDDAVKIAAAFKAHGCDLIDVSSGGNSPRSKPEYGRMFQVPFADAIRHEVGIPVMAVGGIAGADHANTLVASGRADLCALARPHLAHASLTARHAVEEHVDTVWWPKPYALAAPKLA